jgi:phosphoglycerate dehydrogenase-like enzyme
LIIKFILSAFQMSLFNCVFVQRADFFERVYGVEMRDMIAGHVGVLGELIDPEALAGRAEDLQKADFIFTGWGGAMTADMLPYCPRLKAIFFAGGAASHMLNRDLWERGILFSSAYAANAIPVAEYSLAAILLGLKGGWRAISDFKTSHHYIRRTNVAGAYRSTVGLISCGVIARELLRLLRVFDLQTLVYDPYTPDEEIRALGAEPASLQDVFLNAEVVSLHSPELDETKGMIQARHFSLMKQGATFINTSRGSIVNEPELCEIAAKRPDLQFVLDVVHPEPPVENSPLFTLPNVMVTPHIAGAMGGECRRMGQYMFEELERYLAGIPLRWEITPRIAARSIHRPAFMRNTAALQVA